MVRAFVGGVLHDAVINRHVVFGHLLRPLLLTLTQFLESSPKLLGHQIVDDGVDGAVCVNTHPAEEQEPGIEIRRVHKGVDHHQSAVGHPQESEQDHHNSQHLCYLQ